MSCGSKVSNFCGGNKYALRCVDAVGITPAEVSDLFGETCLDGFEVIQDLYSLIGTIYTYLDTTDFETYCVEFTPNENGEITQREVNLGLLKFVCELEQKIPTESGSTTVDPRDVDITVCEFDYGTLVDKCGAPIEDLCELLQALIDEVNTIDALETRVTTLESQVSTLETTVADLVNRVTILES